MYQFYEKEMVAPRVICKESALPDRVKITTLNPEILRIMKNTRQERFQKFKHKQKRELQGHIAKEEQWYLVKGKSRKQ